VSINVLTNQEAGDVLGAAQAAGISRPVIGRIMPWTGPAKYAKVLEAARAGLGVQVGVEAVRNAALLVPRTTQPGVMHKHA
jgi:hypothetical protein